MSKKQSRRDFWRWWREQAEIERTIKVWPYAGEWFWQTPHRMSGRALTRHEAMADAKAAFRAREEGSINLGRNAALYIKSEKTDEWRRVGALRTGLTEAVKSVGRTALAMGRAVDTASRFAEAVEPGE